MIDGGKFPQFSAAPVSPAVGDTRGDELGTGVGDAGAGAGNVDGERQLWCSVINSSLIRTGAKCTRRSHSLKASSCQISKTAPS